MQLEFYSNGKLLITGEYIILKGSTGLALPTKMGQKILVNSTQQSNNSIINWKAFDYENKVWFECKISYPNWGIISTNNTEFSANLILVLKEANSKSNFFNNKTEDFFIETYLDFPNNWGLGSSSTFINNIAQWLHIDPFELLFNTLGGSGYDVACASNNKPIFYSLQNKIPLVTQVKFFPIFHENLFFIHLNKKKESSSALSNFIKNNSVNKLQINRITEISNHLLATKTVEEFSVLITEHEFILSTILNQQPIKEILFKDYPYAIKSLGAWGGDFVLVVTKNKKDLNYFIDKQYTTILSYQEMILA